MQSLSYAILAILISVVGFGQTIPMKQRINGQVVDADSKSSISDVHVIVRNKTELSTTTDSLGYFKLELPVGRHDLEFRMLGFTTQLVVDLPVTSAKEVELLIEMEESPHELAEVVVTPDHTFAKPTNENALASVYSFTVDEAKRLPASISDPARFVMNFPGVGATDDAGNSLVVRGNTPRSMIWRLEGIEIPNPNHFGSWGSTGGGISMLNATMLATSDFYMGAFPPEIGNSLSGAFDLFYRNGNKSTNEQTLQVSTMGVEAAIEGPLSAQKSSSYLINYRYSTLELLKRYISLGDIPGYQDASFKINIGLRKNGVLQFFGLSGFSKSSRVAVRDSLAWQNGERNFEFTSATAMGVLGASYLYPIKKSSYLKIIASGSIESNIDKSDTLNQRDSYAKVITERTRLINRTFRFHCFYSIKIDSRLSFKVGLLGDFLNFKQQYGYLDSDEEKWKDAIHASGSSQLFQGYAQAKLRLNRYLSGVGGIHVSHFMLNNTNTIEPRFTLRYELNSGSIFLATGLHSKTEHISTYFFGPPDNGAQVRFPNLNLKLPKALHIAFGQEASLLPGFTFKYECYYQYLWDIPVEASNESGFSTINTLTGFELIGVEYPLVSKGSGRNMGVDVALKKKIKNGHYLMTTASIFKSTYKNYRGEEFSTRFDRRFLFNMVSGKELKLGTGRKNILGINAKINWTGGLRETPIDVELSQIESKTVYVKDSFFSSKNPDYFRADASAYFIINTSKITHRLQVDIQNITNRRNHFYSYYDTASNSIKTVYQLGLIPNLTYRIDF